MKNNSSFMRKGMVLSLLFLIFLIVNSVQATNLTSCGDVSVSDYYTLNASLNNDTSTCLTLSNNDIVIDCNGYNITFAGTDQSAVFSSGYDNVTVKDCNINQNASDTSLVYAVKMDSTSLGIVFNNSITVHGNNSTGIYSQLSSALNISWNNVTNTANYGNAINSFENNNTNMQFNILESNGIETNGVQYSDNNNIDFINNEVTTYGINSKGIALTGGLNSTENATISDNNVTAYGSGSRGIVDFGTQNVDIVNNTVFTSQDSSRGIMFTQIDDSNVSYNDVTTLGSGSHAVYLIQFTANNTNDNNWIGYNTLNVSSGSNCIGVIEFVPYVGIYQKLFIVSNTLYDSDETDESQALLINGHWNNTELINQEVNEYSFDEALLSYENTTYGLVNFTEMITVNGSDRVLDDDIVIGNNSVFVNSSAINGTANITLYNIGDRGFLNPIILKDGVQCDDCVNYTALDATNVTFSVIGFSTYEIGDNITSIEMTVYSPLNTTYQGSGSTAIVDVEISVNDTLNTAWYEYDSNGTNITYTPNSSIVVGVGAHNLTLWVNNSYGLEDNTIVYFTYEQIIPTGLFGVNVTEAAAELVGVIYIAFPLMFLFVYFGIYKGVLKSVFKIRD